MKLELGLPIPFPMLLVIIVPLPTHLPILEDNILKGLWDFLQVPFLGKFMGFGGKYWNFNAVFLFFLIKNKCNKNYINIYFIPTYIFYTIVLTDLHFCCSFIFLVIGPAVARYTCIAKSTHPFLHKVAALFSIFI